jgi:hypothetical protein
MARQMTRSRHADPAALRHRGVVRGLWLSALLALACSGRELSLGGDPSGLTVGSGGTDGVAAGNGGGPVSGGSGGANSTAGTGGFSLQLGGSAGSAGASSGGAGDRNYPPVRWGNGEGYRNVCPEYDGTSGFTCWYEEAGVGTTCAADGSPGCNACSCAVPCERTSDCPAGTRGEQAICLGSDTNPKSCFLSCDEGGCPIGMTCSSYPGSEDRVCMWVDPSIAMNTPK